MGVRRRDGIKKGYPSFTPSLHPRGSRVRWRNKVALEGGVLSRIPLWGLWMGRWVSVWVKMTFEYFQKRRRRAVMKGFGLGCEMREWLTSLQGRESEGLVLLGVVRGGNWKVKIWWFGFDAEYGSICTGSGMHDRV